MSEPKRIDWIGSKGANGGVPPERPNWCSRCIATRGHKDHQIVQAHLAANPGTKLGGQLYRDVTAAHLGGWVPREAGYKGGPTCEQCFIRERDDRERRIQENYAQQSAGPGAPGGVMRPERRTSYGGR